VSTQDTLYYAAETPHNTPVNRRFSFFRQKRRTNSNVAWCDASSDERCLSLLAEGFDSLTDWSVLYF